MTTIKIIAIAAIPVIAVLWLWAALVLGKWTDEATEAHLLQRRKEEGDK